MQTLLSEAQLERKGVRIVSENGTRSFYKNGNLLFQAQLLNNSYVWKPTAPTVDAQQSREVSCANNTSEFVLQTDALPSNVN